MFTNEKFTDLLIDLHRCNLVFTVQLSPQGVVWRELNNQIIEHLQQFSITLQPAPMSVQSNLWCPPDQQDFHVVTWQLLKLHTHLCQTARCYEAAVRLAVGNFTYNNLVKESGHKHMANPQDTSQPLLVLGECYCWLTGKFTCLIFMPAAPHWGNLQMPISTLFRAEDHNVTYELLHPCFASCIVGPYVTGHTELVSCLVQCPGSHQSSHLHIQAAPSSSLLTSYLNPVDIQPSNPAISEAAAFHAGQCSTCQCSDSIIVRSDVELADI